MAVSDISVLDTVIARVNRQQPDRPGEFYITIKSGSGEIDPPIWRRGVGERYTYRVFTEDAGQPLAEGESNTVHVKDPESNDGVNLTVTYQACCPSGSEKRLVAALGRNGTPSDDLRTRITGCARSYLFGKERELFSNFDKVRQDVLTQIHNTIVDETGLKFRAQLTVKLKDDLASHRIEENAEIRFKDSPQVQRILIQCDLDVIPQLTLRAIVAHQRLMQLQTRLIDVVKDHFRHEVTAQSFAEALRDPRIVNDLRGRFDVLLGKGRPTS